MSLRTQAAGQALRATGVLELASRAVIALESIAESLKTLTKDKQ